MLLWIKNRRVLKTTLFVKVIHKLLRVAIDSGNESYLPQLLHLIHAIIIDDEHIHGKDYLSELFIDIPVCDLLLTIVESNMSKPVVRKADFWLSSFSSKTEGFSKIWSAVLERIMYSHSRGEKLNYLNLKQKGRKGYLRKERKRL